MRLTSYIALLIAAISTSFPAATADTAPPADIPGDTIFGCQDANFGAMCNTIGFVDNVCAQLPPSQVNQMDSVEVPEGWACTFYDAKSSTPCNAETDPHTLLIAPGSSDLGFQHFHDSLDTFLCTQIQCVKIAAVVSVREVKISRSSKFFNLSYHIVT
ncbi:hypothetical protein R3P38DRAFT_3558195 [Favolaschia claudopus]|uniref:Uncharacterized protein n=1 Tax=Favolaschia claudopus TaxID=2862362 RepID=A0AAW0AXZ5_9AGAR